MTAISTKPLRDRLCKLPDKDALCPVCKDIPYENPQQSACGHRFCQPCIDIIAGDNRNRCICPIDSLQVFPTFSDRFYQRDIRNSECHCAFDTEGCGWKGIFADLQEHEIKMRLHGGHMSAVWRSDNEEEFTTASTERLSTSSGALSLLFSACPDRQS